MKFSSNVITFLSIAVTAVAGVQTGGEDEVDCVGEIIDTSTITSLDFLNSVVTKNELHLEGGELRYSDIGFVRDRPVDLVVTVVDGEYTDIAEVWADRGKLPDVQNGKKDDSQFANINLQTVKKKPHSGLGNFQFCFHDTQTNALTTVETFRWSVYDLDERRKGKNGIEERMLMDLTQAQSMQMWPNVEESEIDLMCEDGSASLPCDAGIRTVFHSSTHGVGGDNPTDPNAMTDLQKKRSITFTFTNTDCWVFSYDHYCPGEQEDAERSYYCKSYTGGNFLFSGDSQEIHQDGECVVPPSPPPTEPPTSAPTTPEPTIAPTNLPTSKPTNRPTEPPSVAPIQATTTRPPISTQGDEDEDEEDLVFVPPSCPADVTVLSTAGVTDFPGQRGVITTYPTGQKRRDETKEVVEILRQDTTTVTVGLTQQWTASSSSSDSAPHAVDALYYQYKETIWSTKCYAATQVTGGTVFDTITIQCNILSPYAYLEVCVVDAAQHEVLSATEDTAIIPQCCHAKDNDDSATLLRGEPATPTVCYSLEIRCSTLCADGTLAEINEQEDRARRRMGLRGFW